MKIEVLQQYIDYCEFFGISPTWDGLIEFKNTGIVK